ncbi:MAG: hypothetical protein R3250_08160 [Melioribacteraceae bacterium]|nr:hypothetical protein [Melioribacteraceae bacterium]
MEENISSDITINHHLSVPYTLNEVSGIVTVGNFIIAHNDGDDGPNIYILDKTDPSEYRKIRVKGSKNKDWEDIASDEQYIYIADVGNNNKRRKAFQIYMISIEELLKSDKETQPFHIIDFEYEKKKSPNCEAITIFNDKIYLFTKEKNESRVYTLNREEPWQVAEDKGQFKLKGEITGATGINNSYFMLTGYRKLSETAYRPFLMKVVPNERRAKHWESTKYKFPKSGQMEGITPLSEKQFLVSTERAGFSPARFYNITFQ